MKRLKEQQRFAVSGNVSYEMAGARRGLHLAVETNRLKRRLIRLKSST